MAPSGPTPVPTRRTSRRSSSRSGSWVRRARSRSCRATNWRSAYRDSRFKHHEPGQPRELIVEATFRLEPADPDTIKGRLDEIRHWRQAHQPLGLPSAGSVFRNPPGDSAGRLIEAAGLKGRRIGGAVVSEKHANFVVNDQKGTAAGRPPPDGPGPGRGRGAVRHPARVRGRVPRRLGGVGGGRVNAERVPVVVLLGGPSAEHDVSIVSGTAIADALRSLGHPVRQVLIDLDGGWWWLPVDHERAGRPQAAYDDPTALGADGPLETGAALDRLAATRPAPVVAIALHGPFGEDGTVQALLEAAGLAYTGSGVAASAIGMDKTIFKRLCRGIGLPVVDWREVRASRWAADPRRGARRVGGLRGRGGGLPADGQARPPRQLGRDDPGPSTRRDRDRARCRLPLRLARPGRNLHRWRARPRGVGHRQRSGRHRAVRPGRDRVRPRVLRLRGQVRRGPVRDLVERRGQPGPARHPAQDRPRRLPGDRGRGLRPRRLPAGRRIDLPVRDQHDPRIHPDQPVPDAAGRRRVLVRRRLCPGRSNWRASATRRGSPDRLGPDDLPR